MARQCTAAPVAGAVAYGAPPPPPRAGAALAHLQASQAHPASAPRPPPPAPQASALRPPPPAQLRTEPSSLPAPTREQVGLYKVGRLRARAGGRAAWDGGGRPATESPYERSLRREHELRASSPRRREEVVAGESLYERGLRCERELREAALSSVVGRPAAVALRTDGDRAADCEAVRPLGRRYIIYWIAEVDEAERALRWELVTFVSRTRCPVSCVAATAAIRERFPELDGHFSVHGFWLVGLLFVFDSRAKRDVVLMANPFDGRDFTLRFGVWNRQLQAKRHLFRFSVHLEVVGVPPVPWHLFRFSVHLEVVGVPPVAWNMATAKSLLGSSAWVEHMGMDTTNKSDMGSFRITAWTNDPAAIPKNKKLWLAEPLLFGDEDEDLLLPVDALIPEEVALLEFEVTVHLVRVEGDAAPTGHPLSYGDPDDDPDDDGSGSVRKMLMVLRIRVVASCHSLLAPVARLPSRLGGEVARRGGSHWDRLSRSGHGPPPRSTWDGRRPLRMVPCKLLVQARCLGIGRACRRARTVSLHRTLPKAVRILRRLAAEMGLTPFPRFLVFLLRRMKWMRMLENAPGS
ncbi:hypothetical protein ACQ4PT_032986 [Festuca glaucescens]